MSPETFASRFKEAREKRNITIKALQPKVGASSSAMNNYATGKTLPPLDVAARIAEELNVSLDWLTGSEKGLSQPRLRINSCYDAIRLLQALQYDFRNTEVFTKQKEDKHSKQIHYFVDLTIESALLYEYFNQVGDLNEYYSKLPKELQAGFIPIMHSALDKMQENLIEKEKQDIHNEKSGLGSRIAVREEAANAPQTPEQ